MASKADAPKPEKQVKPVRARDLGAEPLKPSLPKRLVRRLTKGSIN